MSILSLFEISKRKKKAELHVQGEELFIYLPSPPDANIAFFTQHYPSFANNLADASFIIHPLLLRDPTNLEAELSRLSKVYKKFHLRVIVFVLSDYEGQYKRFKNLVLFRTSARRSLLAFNEWILPYLWEPAGESFTASQSSEKPMMGFCGMTTPNRQALMAAFENDPRFVCHFIKREAFWGGKPHDSVLMQEFWENMRNTQFMLAARGAGNFSMRFYQALSMGRIPVLVDNDMELPLSSQINWNELIVFEKSEQACLKKVLGIHQAGQTLQLQKKCYEVYHQVLCEKYFLANLVKELKEL